MARPRKPLATQRGHLTVAFRQRRGMESEIACSGDKLPEKPPSYLDAVAKKEWKRMVAAINKIDSIGEVDHAAFEGYCASYANYVHSTQRLREIRAKIKKNDLEDAMVIKALQEVEIGLITEQKTAGSEVRAFMGKCGFDINGRLKFAAEKVDKAEDELSAVFGVI